MTSAKSGIAVWLGALLLICGMAMPAQAHRLNAGLSVVALSPDGQQVEIYHRLFAHDLADLLPGGPDVDVENEAVQAFLGQYAKAHFVLGYDGKAVAMKYLGAEKDGEYLYIYFTAPPPHGLSTITIWNTLLQDELPDQKNLTNIRIDGSGQTLSVYSTRENPAKNLVLAVR